MGNLKKIIYFSIVLNLTFITIFNGIELTYFSYFSIILTLITLVLFSFYVRNVKLLTIYTRYYTLWLFVLVFALLTIFSYYRYASFVGLIKILSGVVNFFILSSVVGDNDFRDVLFLFSFVGLFVSISSIFEYFTFVLFPSSWLSNFFVSNGFIQGTRLGTFFQYPNATGTFLIFFFILLLGLYATEDLKKRSNILLVESVIVLFSIYLADSRGAYISLFAVLVFLLIFVRKKPKFLKSALIVIGITGLLIVINNSFFAPLVEERAIHTKQLLLFLKGEGDFSLQSRIQLILGALNIFKHHPIFGTGLSTFRDAILNYRVGLFYAVDPHSLFARLFAETGIFGSCAFVAFLFSIFIPIKDIFKDDLGIFAFASVFSMFIHLNLDLSFQYLSIILLFFIGLALAGSKKKVHAGVLGSDSFMLILIAFIFGFTLVFLVPESISSIYATSGEKYLASGDIVHANADFRVAVKGSKYNADYLTNLSITYEELAKSNISKDENLKNALYYLELAFKENRLSFYIPLRIARLYLYDKNDNAVYFARLALQRNPLWVPIKSEVALAIAYVGNSNPAEVYKLTNDALNFKGSKDEYSSMNYITEEENFSTSYAALGFANINNTSSNEYFKKAIEIFKNNPFAYFGLSKRAYLENNLILEVEDLYKAININPCIKEAYERYFEVAPIIKVETNLNNVQIKPNSTLDIKFSILRNRDLLNKIEFGIEDDKGVVVFKDEIPVNMEMIKLTIPEDVSRFRIFIKGIDRNGVEVVEVRSILLKANS